VADPRAYDTVVDVAFKETLGALQGLCERTPELAEPYSNPALIGSPRALLDAAVIEAQVREPHGDSILLRALVGVLAELERRLNALEDGAKWNSQGSLPSRAEIKERVERWREERRAQESDAGG
jgi:hypothetical protein